MVAEGLEVPVGEVAFVSAHFGLQEIIPNMKIACYRYVAGGIQR
jgi:hypothetical protein